MTNTTDPVAHDTRLLDLLRDVAAAQSARHTAGERMLKAASVGQASHTGELQIVEDHRVRYVRLTDQPAGTLYYQSKTFHRGDEGYWIRTGPETYARKRATVADAAERLPADHPALSAYSDAREALKAAGEAVRVHEQGYTGWTRYFLVTSSAGHVHAGMDCTTCYPTTTYAPVVSLSGSTAGEAVDVLGETLCSVCFPEAPVNGRPAKISKAAAAKLLK